ncbi:MAG TPA: helix-turn-helix transcriptional regulator [Gammaproteobacteria bacterium]|nr:helix-turn-helix transcriptional regulator [Gammaproteobacteria bacterium]
MEFIRENIIMLGQIQLRKEIAGRLRRARENAGYSSAEGFCETYGILMNDYYRHESGSQSIKASHAILYCRLLKVSLHWLMIGGIQKLA